MKRLDSESVSVLCIPEADATYNDRKNDETKTDMQVLFRTVTQIQNVINTWAPLFSIKIVEFLRLRNIAKYCILLQIIEKWRLNGEQMGAKA